MEAACSCGVILIFKVCDRRFEWPNDFNGASSDDDEHLVLRFLRFDIIAVGRRTQFLLLDGLYRLRFSAWLVMLLMFELSCSLENKMV